MARLIDTSVFIEVERRGYSPEALPATVLAEPAFLSAVTVSELFVGVFRAATPAQRSHRQAFVEGILKRIPVVPFDLAVARVHARLAAEMRGTGQAIGAHDLLIAATAVAHGYAVLTHNLVDFDRVPGLVVDQLDW